MHDGHIAHDALKRLGNDSLIAVRVLKLLFRNI